MVKKYVYTGPIKHYCACCGKLLKTEWSGRYESDLDSVMQVDSDGFAIVRDRLCGECQYEENAVAIKKSGKVFKFLAIAAIVILFDHRHSSCRRLPFEQCGFRKRRPVEKKFCQKA